MSRQLEVPDSTQAATHSTADLTAAAARGSGKISLANDASRQHRRPKASAREALVHGLAAATSLGAYAIAYQWTSDTTAFLLLLPLIVIIFDAAYAHITEIAATIIPKSRHQNVCEAPSKAAAIRARPPLVIPALIRESSDISAVADCIGHVLSLDSYGEVCGIAVLVDFADGDDEVSPSDAFYRLEIDELLSDFSRRSDIPVLAHYRRRTWNKFESRWMGWERKRGKLVEFLKHTRGLPTSYIGPCPSAWSGCDYVMTIDIETRLDTHTVSRLVAAIEGASAMAIATPALRTLDSQTESIDRWLIEPSFFEPPMAEPAAAQLVFGCELFSGKGIIRVDTFLKVAADLPENCVLSHDHLEALMGGACAVATAPILEPFPATRSKWERRQHRWFRGDLQILPWGLIGRSWYAGGHGRLTWQAQSTALRIALNPVNLFTRYLSILALLVIDPSLAFCTLFLLVLAGRQGLLAGFLAFVRTRVNSYRQERLLPSLGFYVLNSLLRSIGEIVYFQRLALLACHAAWLVLWRMAGGRRHRLLEWYPDEPDSVITARRWMEATVLCAAIAAALFSQELILLGSMVGAWSLAAAIIPRKLARSSLASPKQLVSY